MPAEFDAYARTYAEDLSDPLREHFAGDSRFFAERKLLLIQDFFRRRGQDTRAMSWIDLGCGQGELLRLGQSHFADVAGCDPSDQMIAKCENLNVRHQKDPDIVPFSDASFDLVTAVCVYHHVDVAMRSLLTQEAVRILKPNGIFCIIEHNPFNPITQLIVRRSPVDVNARLLRAGTAKGLSRAAGAEVVETRYFLYFPERFYGAFTGLEDKLAGIPLGGQFAVFGRKPSL